MVCWETGNSVHFGDGNYCRVPLRCQASATLSSSLCYIGFGLVWAGVYNPPPSHLDDAVHHGPGGHVRLPERQPLSHEVQQEGQPHRAAARGARGGGGGGGGGLGARAVERSTAWMWGCGDVGAEGVNGLRVVLVSSRAISAGARPPPQTCVVHVPYTCSPTSAHPRPTPTPVFMSIMPISWVPCRTPLLPLPLHPPPGRRHFILVMNQSVLHMNGYPPPAPPPPSPPAPQPHLSALSPRSASSCAQGTYRCQCASSSSSCWEDATGVGWGGRGMGRARRDGRGGGVGGREADTRVFEVLVPCARCHHTRAGWAALVCV